MANEIRVGVSLQCTNANLKIPRVGGTTLVNQAAAKGGPPGMINAVTTGTGTQITTTGITTPGWAYVKNLDGTNFVEVGPVSGGVFYPMVKLKPGEEFPFRFASGAAIWIKANTAACDCLAIVLND